MQINRLNNIQQSFKGLYTVKAQENPDKLDEIRDLEDRYSYHGRSIYAYSEIPEDHYSYRYATTNFIGQDYDADDEIETMLANKGINFTRTSFAKLLDSPESVKERVILDPDDKRRGLELVEVDRFNFDMNYEDYGFGYIGRGSNISQPERMERFEEYLKTGKKIYAPVVYVNDNGRHPEITFQDGRHRYAYMRDMKMQGIPIAMNEESIKVAKKYGLLQK